MNHNSDYYLMHSLSRIIKMNNSNHSTIAIIPFDKSYGPNKFKDFDKVLFIENLVYTKNIYRLIKNTIKLKQQLKGISFRETNYFISYELFSLNSIIIFNYLKNKVVKIILTSNFKQENFNNKKINYFKTVLYSINTLITSGKLIKAFNFKSTVYPIIDLKYFSDYYIIFNDGDSSKSIKTKNKIRIKHHPILELKSDINRVKSQDRFVLLIIVMQYSSINNKYIETVHKLISSLQNNNINFLLKDHPRSSYKNNHLKELFNLNKKNHLKKEISIEEFMIENRINIENVIGPLSTVLTTADHLNLPTICYSPIFETRYDYLDSMNINLKKSDTKVVNSIDQIIFILKNKSDLKSFKLSNVNNEFSSFFKNL